MDSNCFDWKCIVALGGVTIGAIFVVKMPVPSLEKVSIHLIDAAKELAIAYQGDC